MQIDKTVANVVIRFLLKNNFFFSLDYFLALSLYVQNPRKILRRVSPWGKRGDILGSVLPVYKTFGRLNCGVVLGIPRQKTDSASKSQRRNKAVNLIRNVYNFCKLQCSYATPEPEAKKHSGDVKDCSPYRNSSDKEVCNIKSNR